MENKILNRFTCEKRRIRLKFDSEKVDWVIEAEQQLITETSKLRQFLVSLRSEDTQAHLYVTDRLLRIGEAAKDITDLALPHT